MPEFPALVKEPKRLLNFPGAQCAAVEWAFERPCRHCQPRQVRYTRERGCYLMPAEDANLPATKQDLRHLRDELTETMRDMQSEILRGIEGFARGNFARMHLETRRPPL
jgi:hypothetical protein